MNSTLPYLLLACGILAEIAATISLKFANGIERPGYLIIVAAGYTISFTALAFVLRSLPVSMVYAIWAGCGVAGTAAFGVLCLDEPLGLRQMLGFLAIVLGVGLLSR